MARGNYHVVLLGGGSFSTVIHTHIFSISGLNHWAGSDSLHCHMFDDFIHLLARPSLHNRDTKENIFRRKQTTLSQPNQWPTQKREEWERGYTKKGSIFTTWVSIICSHPSIVECDKHSRVRKTKLLLVVMSAKRCAAVPNEASSGELALWSFKGPHAIPDSLHD